MTNKLIMLIHKTAVYESSPDRPSGDLSIQLSLQHIFLVSVINLAVSITHFHW